MEKVIQNKHLYGVGEDSPLRNIHGATYGMGLYGYGGNKKPKGTGQVLAAIKQGWPLEAIEDVVPDLTPRQIDNAVSYLDKQGLIDKEKL
jgi:hypothetical protein